MHILQPAGAIPYHIIAYAKKIGDGVASTAADGAYNASYIDGITLYIIQSVKFNNITKTRIVQLSGLKLITSTRSYTDKNLFSMDSTISPVYASELDNVGVDSVDLTYGNYTKIVMDEGDVSKVYSISTPAHDLAGDYTRALVRGWNRFSWQTNVTLEDVYTCFSPTVYNTIDELVGTEFPPEGAFKTGLIIGIGVDSDGVVHIAQNVQIPKDSGYFGHTKQGVNTKGLFYEITVGTRKQAEDHAVASGYLSPTTIYTNTDDKKRWFVEFLKGSGGVGVKSHTNQEGWEIVSRKDSARTPAQWFYINNQWVQYQQDIPTKFSFDGLKNYGGVYNTKYTLNYNDLLNTKKTEITHSAISDTGVSGSSMFTELNIVGAPSKQREEVAEAVISVTFTEKVLTGSGYMLVTWGTSNIPSTTKSGTPNPLSCMTAQTTYTWNPPCTVTSCTALNGSDATCANGTYSSGLGYLENVSIQYNQFGTTGAPCAGFNAGFSPGDTSMLGKYGVVQELCNVPFTFGCIGFGKRCHAWFFNVTKIFIDDRFLSDSYLQGTSVPVSTGGYKNKVTKVEFYGCTT